ncbi:hypothetical protein WJX81_005284 [Elliptochloris bilobata]|uniref:DM10 domain-containing protein n=1 Tax=Elliptochloris bilobata TaxID=381761 RepID=A0AAW1RCR1_9CHLO
MPGAAIPLLPGYSNPQAPPGDRTFYKGQTLNFQKGYANVIEGDLLPVVGEVRPCCRGASAAAACADAQPSSSAPRVPQWLENDRQVLRWMGYFTESVPQSPAEDFRVRRVEVRYYLEDDTVDVAEPKQLNSGLPQGALMKRHSAKLRPADLAVGAAAVIYGHKIHVVDADAFTRAWLVARGTPVADPEPYPEGTIEARARRRREAAAAAPKPARLATGQAGPKGNLREFLEADKKVLRFYCVWDDRSALYGDRRPYRLHAFPDGGIEILETRDANSGRDPFPVFLRRALLPKNPATAAGGVLERSACYGPSDLRMGATVSVYGRDFLIVDCDDFTRKWLLEDQGCTAAEAAPLDVTEHIPQPAPRPLPPYNGFGSLEDSAQSCRSLIPQPPRRDFVKLMNLDKIVLRFGCRMIGGGATEADQGRRFVLSYFMADDTMSVFEPPVRNSGIVGGKFLERRPVYAPGGKGVLVTDRDLFVGERLTIAQRVFQLTEADDFTMQYMENSRWRYPHADWEAALASARSQLAGHSEELRGTVVSADPDATGALGAPALAAALAAAGAELSAHQSLALHRRLAAGDGSGGSVPVEALLHALLDA